MNEIWEKLAESLAAKIDDLVTAKLRSFLERFCRSEIKVIYSETEAAAFLGVSRDTLSHWRKRGIITYCRYPRAKVAEDKDRTEDSLSDMYSYGLADLMSFHERFKVKTPAKNVAKRLCDFGTR